MKPGHDDMREALLAQFGPGIFWVKPDGCAFILKDRVLWLPTKGPPIWIGRLDPSPAVTP